MANLNLHLDINFNGLYPVMVQEAHGEIGYWKSTKESVDHM